MFQPELLCCDADGVDIKFPSCPLEVAWQEAELSDDEVAEMCEIATAVDSGTFEEVGFKFSTDTCKPGGEGCCLFHIRPEK
jgi:hypothetical protein